MNKQHTDIDDGIINLNGEIADRERAEQKLLAAKGSGKERLTDDEDETLDELKAKLAKRAKLAESGDPGSLEQMTKSLGHSISNFLRRRVRREQTMAKSLRAGKRLVLPARSGGVSGSLLIKASAAYEAGIITGTQLNTIDVAHRAGFRIEDAELLAKIRGA
ncbi:hypothetical protein [Aeromonas sp. FDAARGOS 1407]|uniref:hypothetical protein n=1 Tax=Aeromonas TaxID=642 RepID=UPI001C2281EC|nr:hypothetical protein [Aeromonas sp. FDAARGOS 1407]QXC36163.1 hypothetical protein I6L37_11190 [Aeromonas sp. FDAARGOS 1407]